MKLRWLFVLGLILIDSTVMARGYTTVGNKPSPWFTGPLIAPAGRTMPPGYFNFEPYGFYTVYPAGFRNLEGIPVLTAGVWDFLDLQTAIPIDYSWVNHTSANDWGVGDYIIGVGIQVLKQKEDSLIPDLRVTIQEIFPTGKFDNLDPNKLGTDQTGFGAYQTLLGFNFQRLTALPKDHFLRTRFSFLMSKASKVHVEGLSVFGGSPGTSGTVDPGKVFSFDLAFEYSLTQNWVPVFEVLHVTNDTSAFSGNPGFTPSGAAERVGGGGGYQTSLAPALEYNFNENLGIIGGLWFSINGPSAAAFKAYTIAINYVF